MKIPLVVLQIVFITSGWTETVSGPTSGKCERINSELCSNLRYEYTVMPNFMGDRSQRDANLRLSTYEVFLNHSCSPHIRLFICSVFVPLCSDIVPDPILACKGLCENVRDDCVPALRAMHLEWPEELDCDRFVEPPNLCMQPELAEEEHAGAVEHNVSVDVYNLNRCPESMRLEGDRCVAVCDVQSEFEKKQVDAFEIWVAVWSIIGLVFTTFAILTFLVQPKRFRWPARPILYLIYCGFVTSTIYLVRWIEGPYTCVGESLLVKPSESLSCVGISLILLFCDIAYTLWWCVFSFVWFLSAMKEWSTEAIERLSTRLHATVWILSALPMFYIIISNNIQINYLSGFCQVHNVVLINFQLAFLVLSVILNVFTSIALKNVRRTLIVAGRSPLKLERLYYRLIILSVGICVPYVFYLICQYFNTFTIILVKLVLRKVSIIFATLWVFSPKTFHFWRDLVVKIGHKRGDNEQRATFTRLFPITMLFPNIFKSSTNNKTTVPLMPVTKV